MDNAPLILIADDEPFNIALFRELLIRENYRLIFANDGQGAVDLALQENPDLIILDWTMPRMDGLEAMRIIKNNPQTADIPVIMITGIMTTPENLMLSLQAGAADYLRKPFVRSEFIARVKSALLLSRATRDLAEKYRIIQNSSSFIRSLIESVPHPLVYYSLDGMILGCNEMFAGLTGRSEADLTDTLIYRQFSNESAGQHLNADMELVRNRSGKSYEARFGESEQDFIFSKNLFLNACNEPAGILLLLTDVSELKRSHDLIMESKKKELVSSALRMIQISEMNNSLISELASLNPYVNGKGSGIIRQIISRYGVGSDERIWEDFLTRFENVYESFYKRLQERCPDLTPGELRLCALLRLNVSTKDIAAITFQNPQSIDTARYRLRRKLNLDPDDNLVDFLLKLDS
jgi:CheY-like chemotaxis protein/DNA-binding CsgD family transcriptional regulator